MLLMHEKFINRIAIKIKLQKNLKLRDNDATIETLRIKS